MYDSIEKEKCDILAEMKDLQQKFNFLKGLTN
jgi:hypothetical protein